MTATVFGYTACSECSTAVLNEIAWKSGGLCAGCFRAKTNPLFDEIIAVTKDRERIRLRVHASRRSPGDRAQRRRAKDRARQRPDNKERARLRNLSVSRAKTRLSDIFPEIYEILLADERAKLGMESWSIERALTPHQATGKTYQFLASYHASHKDNP